MPLISFYRASNKAPLTKTHAMAGGEYQQTNFMAGVSLSSRTDSFETIEELLKCLEAASIRGECLVKGSIKKELNNESRKGNGDKETPTEYLVLDLDGVTGFKDIDEFLSVLPATFQTTDYIIHHSASSGVLGKVGLRVHLFFLLAQPLLHSQLTKLLMNLNFEHERIEACCDLTETRASLSYAVDPTVGHATALIYIAPPIFKNMIPPKLRRWALRKRANRSLEFDKKTLTGLLGDRQAAYTRRFNELRGSYGLEPQRRNKFGNDEVQRVKDTATIQVVADEGDFVRVNLNGGDSNGYYYVKANPVYLRNFKHEPMYPMKDLDPEFATRISLKAKAEASENLLTKMFEPSKTGEDVHLTFIEASRDCIFYGMVNEDKGQIKLTRTSTIKYIEDYFAALSPPRAIPDPMPFMDLIFNPTSDVVIDRENKRINLWAPSKYMRQAKRCKGVPKHIKRVIWNVTGSNRETYDRFINWLAFIYQFKKQTTTAWIFHGTQGTGKGALFALVLRPLFGDLYIPKITIDALENQYNKWAENALIVQIDEIEAQGSTQRQAVARRLKTLVADASLAMRAMRQDSITVSNYSNYILLANVPNCADVPMNDRRFNVAPSQKLPLTPLTPDDEQQILEAELYHFAGYLRDYKVDVAAAMTPLDNEARRLAQAQTRTALDNVLIAIVSGDLPYFMQEIKLAGGATDDRTAHHKASVERIIDEACRDIENERVTFLNRERLRELVSFCIGMRSTPVGDKFTSLLSVMGHSIEHDGTTPGMEIQWHCEPVKISKWKKSRPKHMQVVK